MPNHLILIEINSKYHGKILILSKFSRILFLLLKYHFVHLIKRPKKLLKNHINFNDEMIIAVFQGGHSSGGYSIKIKRINEKENSVEVFVKETSPSPLSGVTDALTQPYHIVKTKRVDKEVIFKR